MTKFQQRVYKAVKRIPRGKVVTYAGVARAVGAPRAVRAVGNALHKNVSLNIPCHRVIRSDGNVGGYNRGTQRKVALLAREGVGITHYLVNRQHILSWKKILSLK